MGTLIVFTITNELTGWRVDVISHDNGYTVEQCDVDGLLMGFPTYYRSECAAISHAVLLS